MIAKFGYLRVTSGAYSTINDGLDPDENNNLTYYDPLVLMVLSAAITLEHKRCNK